MFSQAVRINVSCLSIPCECPERPKSLGKNCKVTHCAMAVGNVGMRWEEVTGNMVMQILLESVTFLLQAGDPAISPKFNCN